MAFLIARWIARSLASICLLIEEEIKFLSNVSRCADKAHAQRERERGRTNITSPRGKSRGNSVLSAPLLFKWTIAEWIKLRQFCTLRADLEGNGPDGLTTPGRRSERAKVRGWSGPSKQPPASVDPRKTRSQSHFKFLPIGSSIFDDCYRGINRCHVSRNRVKLEERGLDDRNATALRNELSERTTNKILHYSAYCANNFRLVYIRTRDCTRPLKRTTFTRKSRQKESRDCEINRNAALVDIREGAFRYTTCESITSISSSRRSSGCCDISRRWPAGAAHTFTGVIVRGDRCYLI
jgi:hypothetical protein